MFKWKKGQSVERVNAVFVEPLPDNHQAADERLTALEKRLLEVEDRLTEMEFNSKVDLQNATTCLTQLKENVEVLSAQWDRVASLATKISTNAASKEEFANLVNTLASSLKVLQDKMNLPF